MIKDKLTNADTYYGISERLKQGFEWLKNNDLLNIPDGRYLIDGEKIFANVQSYITKDDAPYEAHRRYADIQYMIKGLEKVGVTVQRIKNTIKKKILSFFIAIYAVHTRHWKKVNSSYFIHRMHTSRL